MDPLFVRTASDGSSLILGEDPADPQQPFRLVSCQDGPRRPSGACAPGCRQHRCGAPAQRV